MGECLVWVSALMCLQKVVKTAKVYTYSAINYTVILYVRRLTASWMKHVTTTGAHMNACTTLIVVDVTSHLNPIDKLYHSPTPQSDMDTNQVYSSTASIIHYMLTLLPSYVCVNVLRVTTPTGHHKCYVENTQ